MIDLMIHFFFEIPSDVITYSNKIVTKKDNFHFDDFFQSNFFFKSKAIAKITTNFGAVHNHQHVVKIFGTKSLSYMMIREPGFLVIEILMKVKKLISINSIMERIACCLKFSNY